MRSPIPIIFVLVIAVVLRIAALSDRSLWFDETLSWRLAHLQWLKLPTALSISPHPPAYFIVLRIWVFVFGDSPVAVRGLSVFAGVITVFGLYLFVRRLVPGVRGEFTAVLAAALLALSPFHIRYSVEARMYAMAAAGAVWTSWLMLRALDTKTLRWRSWLTYTALAIPFVYTHYFAYFTVTCQAAYALWLFCEEMEEEHWWRVHHHPGFKHAATAFVLIGGALLIWAPFLFTHLTAGSNVRDWQQSLGSEWQVFAILYQLVIAPEISPTETQSVRVVLALGLVFFTLHLKRVRGAGLLTLLAIGPVLLMAGAGAIGAKLMIARYLAVSQPFMIAAIAVSTTNHHRSSSTAVVGFLILVAASWLCADNWGPSEWSEKPGYRGAANFISRERQTGEPIIVANGFAYLPVHYHSTDRRDLFALAPETNTFLDGQHLMTEEEILLPIRLVEQWGRYTIWVVNSIETGGDRKIINVPNEWSESGRWPFPDALYGGVEVVRYNPRLDHQK